MKLELPVNQFKQAIKAGKPQIGIWSSCSYISAEVLSDAGLTWCCSTLAAIKHERHEQ